MQKMIPMSLLMAAVLAAPAAAQQTTENLGTQALRELLQGQSAGGQQDDQTVRRLLEERGYTDVGEVKRVFRTTARRDGRDVTLTIDAESGRISADRGRQTTAAGDGGRDRGRQVRNESNVRDLLNDQGYTRVTNVRRQGDQFEADAERDGQQVSVSVDGQTGEIQELN